MDSDQRSEQGLGRTEQNYRRGESLWRKYLPTHPIARRVGLKGLGSGCFHNGAKR